MEKNMKKTAVIIAPAKDTNPNRWENGTQSYKRFLRNYLLQLPHILEAKSRVGITEVKHITQLPINR